MPHVVATVRAAKQITGKLRHLQEFPLDIVKCHQKSLDML